MATSSKELELLAISEKRYSIYIIVLLLTSVVLFYIFGPFLPWKIYPVQFIASLAGLFLFTILVRILTPKKFAKISLYAEIFFNVIAIGFIAYFSGGIVSPFNFAFIIPVVFAMFLAGITFGWIIFGFSIASIAFLIFLPAGFLLLRIQAVTLFLMYTLLLIYLALIFLLLRQSFVRLEEARKAVQERVALLENITARLKTLDQLKTEFVTRASHQLRTPLSELKWGFEALLVGEEGSLQENQKLFLRKMATSVENLILLVGQLLDISRIESEKTEYATEKVDILPLIKSIIEQYIFEIKKKRLNVSLEPAEHIYVKGELRGLEIALHNIIENAIQYTPENGVITIFFEQENNFAVIHVRDTGIGISKEEQKLLFTRFSRGARATRMVADGTGLGLSISKDIIEKLQGKIIIESEENKGTEVKIFLPVFSAEENDAA